MGECEGVLVPSFNGSIRIEGRPERLTDNPGALLQRETAERLNIIEWLDERLDDPRNPELITHPLSELLRDSLLESTARRVRAMNREHRPRYITLDIDSLPAEVYGHQPGSEYNGHYHARIYHPLVASIAETGDIIDLRLRKGSVHTAEDSLDFILPLLDRVENRLCQVASVRIDAGFPDEPLLAVLEERRTPYVSRIKNNPVLDTQGHGLKRRRMAEPHIRRPVGRRTKQPRVFFHEMTYGAESWSRERLLRTAARVLIHGRRATVVLGQAASELWAKLWPVLCSFEVVHS